MTWWLYVGLGYLLAAAAGYAFRAWQERGWKENARPGVVKVSPKDAVDKWSGLAPFDQELQQIADVMDVAAGKKTA